MLTVLECVKGLKDSQVEHYKAEILRAFYTNVLDNASHFKTTGTIFLEPLNYDSMLKAYNELVEYKYDIRSYTTLDQRYLEDKEEFVIEFDLEKEYKQYLDLSTDIG
jgi:hypothetical protein